MHGLFQLTLDPIDLATSILLSQPWRCIITPDNQVFQSQTVPTFRLPLLFFPVPPNDEYGCKDDSKDESEPSTIHELRSRGCNEQSVQREEDQPNRYNQEPWETPDDDGDKSNQVCCDEGDQYNAESIGVAELRRVVVDSRDNDGSNHQQPVGDRYEDLSVEFVARVDHFDLGKVAGVHDLGQQLESTGDQCLRGNNRGQYGQDERRIEHARRNGLEERIIVCRWIDRNARSLAEVC